MRLDHRPFEILAHGGLRQQQIRLKLVVVDFIGISCALALVRGGELVTRAAVLAVAIGLALERLRDVLLAGLGRLG